ncbi:MAG: peptidylprolyl isomerase, partial [Myxococcota bacterium]|nr:peptidylprolyl isomerase [Myxococcota bacterium]
MDHTIAVGRGSPVSMCRLRGLRALALALTVGAAFLCRDDARADDAAAADRRERIVARVGPAVVRVRDFEDRFAALAPFQRAAFGRSAYEAHRRFLDDVLVKEELLALAATGRKLEQQASTAFAIERARSDASVRAIRTRIGPAAAIADEEVRRFYDEHRARYDVPERYQLWRILCKTREEAASVLDEAKRSATPAAFTELARAHSLDKATYLRAGNLGFVTADGVSNEPGFRVAPGIVQAAQAVRDGELVPTPVAEGDSFSVVWRRGTIAARKQTLDDAAASIRD